MQFVEDEDVAVVRRQPGQRAPYLFGRFVGQHPGQRAGRFRGRFGCVVVQVGIRQRRLAPARLLVLEDQQPRHAEQEMLQAAAQGVEGEAPGQQAHEAFLHDVGGGVGRAAAQQGEAVQRALVAPVQGREGGGVSGVHPAQQVVVRGGGCDGHGVISHPYSGRAAGKFQLFFRAWRFLYWSIQFTRSNLLRKSSGMATTWLVL